MQVCGNVKVRPLGLSNSREGGLERVVRPQEVDIDDSLERPLGKTRDGGKAESQRGMTTVCSQVACSTADDKVDATEFGKRVLDGLLQGSGVTNVGGRSETLAAGSLFKLLGALGETFRAVCELDLASEGTGSTNSLPIMVALTP